MLIMCVFLQSCLSKVFDLSDGGVSQYAWFPCEESQHQSWNTQYRLKVRYRVERLNMCTIRSDNHKKKKIANRLNHQFQVMLY